MYLILSIISSKGGVGSSTLTYNIAVRLLRDGYSVCIVDRDNNRTCRDWSNNRQQQIKSGADLRQIDVFTFPDANLKSSLRSIRHEYDVIIIDGMAALDSTTVKIIDNSDYILVPFYPSWTDLSALSRFSSYVTALCEERDSRLAPTGMVFNRFDPQVSENWTFRSGLRKHPFNTFAQRISCNPIYQKSFLEGMGIVEMYDDDGRFQDPVAVHEFELFYRALLTRLRKQVNYFR